MRGNVEAKGFGILRIAFGLVWLVDAYFKWSPGFSSNFVSYLQNGAQGQPLIVAWWIHFWINAVNIDPYFFAIVVAVAETAIALSLIFGIFSRIAIYGGIAMAFVIWSTAEGFGGPYVPGSTDIGASVIYILVFIALLLSESWKEYSIARWINRKIQS